MNVEPTCRFCKRRMAPLIPFQSRGQTLYSFYCQRCRSEQLFNSEASPLEYSFRVGEYLCQFNMPGATKFQIVRDNKLNPRNQELVLKLDFIPHNLKPDNTTEDRIKTLILFS